MGNLKSKAMIRGGLLCLAAALCLVGYNLWDARRASESAAEILRRLEARAQTPLSPDDDAPTRSPLPEPEVPADPIDPDMEMPTIELDGNAYIGTLEIPPLGLSLPVMSDWSSAKLKTAPCRYTGSAYADDLIVAAHNYPAHFGRLPELNVGDELYFTDTADHTFAYTVTEIEELAATALEEMESGDWDLTLFTCTVDGKARVAVRCELATTDPTQPAPSR